jgi:hypothetical protein
LEIIGKVNIQVNLHLQQISFLQFHFPITCLENLKLNLNTKGGIGHLSDEEFLKFQLQVFQFICSPKSFSESSNKIGEKIPFLIVSAQNFQKDFHLFYF